MLITNFVMSIIMLISVGCISCGKAVESNIGTGKWKLLTGTDISDLMALRPIKFFDQRNGISLSLAIENTSDSGKNWKTVFFEEGKGAAAGTFTSESEGWVVGHTDTITPLVLKTVDSGKNWSEITFDEKSTEQLNGKIQVLWDICFDPKGIAWMLGDGGILQVQVNEKHLRLLSMFPSGEVSDRISCSSSGDVWVIGRSSSIFHFHDAWEKKDLNQTYSLTNVRTFGTDVWLMGKDESGYGILLKSVDSGKTWQNKAPQSVKALNDLFLKDSKGWLIGAEGSIYFTTNSGESWNTSEGGTDADLLYIYSLDLDNVWISGDRATILKYAK